MGEIFGFIIAILVGVWVYKDAEKRYPENSSAPGYWALGTILLLIIFLPLYLIFRPKGKESIQSREKYSDNAEERAEAFNFCSQCGYKLEDNNNFCPNCGNNIKTLNNKEKTRKKREDNKNN